MLSILKILDISFIVRHFSKFPLPNFLGFKTFNAFLTKSVSVARPRAINGNASSYNNIPPDPSSSIILKNSLENLILLIISFYFLVSKLCLFMYFIVS